MVEGKILVVGYSKDEHDNYTIELSNGETVTIYSGKVDMNDMPLMVYAQWPDALTLNKGMSFMSTLPLYMVTVSPLLSSMV